MKGFVYVLKCSNGKYYTGSTTNLEKRLWQHQNGEGSNFTKAHLPVELVYVEEFERIDDARIIRYILNPEIPSTLYPYFAKVPAILETRSLA